MSIIESSDESVTQIKNVFHPFLPNENLKEIDINSMTNQNFILSTPTSNAKKEKTLLINTKPKSNAFSSNLRKKTIEIKNLFNIKESVFHTIRSTKPPALIRLEKGMKEYFFGPKGIVSQNLKWYKKLITKKRQYSIGIYSKINFGSLAYLDMNNTGTISNRKEQQRRTILEKSANFIINNGQFNTEIYRRDSQIKSTRKSINVNENTPQLHTQRHSKMHSIYRNNNTINSNNNSNKRSRNTIQNLPSLSIQLSDNETSNTNNNNNINNKHHHTINNSSNNTYRYHSSLFNTPYLSLRTQNQKLSLYKHNNSPHIVMPQQAFPSLLMKTTKKELNIKLDQVDNNYNKLGNKLFRLIDKSNTSKPIIKDVKNKERKFAKDVEAILDAKVRKTSPAKTKQLYRNAIRSASCNKKYSLLSKTITKVNDETALQLADKLANKYVKKTKHGKFYIPKKRTYVKYNYDMKIRNKCVNNQEKMQKMTFSLDKLKQKYEL